MQSQSLSRREVAVPLSRVRLRGQYDPWTMLRDAVAHQVGVEPAAIPIDEVRLAPQDYGPMQAEVRLFGMLRALRPEEVEQLPRGRVVRGLPAGYAYAIIADGGRP